MTHLSRTNRRSLSDLQLLRAFVVVAHTGSVSRAAEQLFVTQSAVSLQLKSLAEQTGLTLFTRQPRGLQLTLDGAALLPRAERVLASLTEFNDAANGLRDSGVHGLLRIGTILDPEFIRLGAFLRQLVEVAPRVETELRQAKSGTVLAELQSHALDVGFYLFDPRKLDLPPGEDDAVASRARMLIVHPFAVRVLTLFDYRVVAPQGWEARVLGQDWKGLGALPWLGTPEASPHSRLLSAVFGPGSSTGLTPQRVALVDQESSMLDLVKSGVGLSLMRDSIAIRESQTHGLVVADKVALRCALTFVCLQVRREDPVVATAWDALGDAWQLPRIAG
ncbi:Gcv operon activator (plasmid) [Variovorax sp. SRS16]|uniref:LysR family transcriptional regulator n=1 Tax=Variovorax sp. SRS16 TaxID=282217 RepID=UPI00131911AC|nr:LysR family transcriptional regulator [Variovorax sp. SRS16]VTU45657.1 Gcv operon activator [Variovorax sp. SRS16]